MITPGLVSVSFRQLSASDIIGLVVQAGLGAIEWGGDIHVPVGDTKNARLVGRQTREAGLQVADYGSYYKFAPSEANSPAFEQVLETAVALGAPAIRVWAGSKGSAEITSEERASLVETMGRIGDLAAACGVTIGVEFHSGTLTDTNDSAVKFFEEIGHPNIRPFWQPPLGQSYEYCLDGLQSLLPRLSVVHIFHWWPTLYERQPLQEGAKRWQNYLGLIKQSGRDLFALLEFVRDDSPEAFLEDARTLRNWLAEEKGALKPI